VLRKKSVLLVLIAAVFLSSCLSTKQLDLETLESNVFHVSKITLMVNQEIDTDNSGEKFIKEQFPELLSVVKTSLEESHNIVIDDKDFLTQIDNGTLNVELETIEFSMIINNYSWENSAAYDQTTSLILPFAPKEGGVLSVMVNLEKVNSEDESNPFTMDLEVPVTVESKDL